MQLPSALFRNGSAAPSLGTVEDRLVEALNRAGYNEHSFHRVPDGFAVVARLERITGDGDPLPGPLRYQMDTFSLSGYLRALFFAPEGLYRLIAIIVTDQPYAAVGAPLDAAAANRLLREGGNRLPKAVRDKPFTPEHRVDALIYEFSKGALAGEVAAIRPGRLMASDHLERSRIMPALARTP